MLEINRCVDRASIDRFVNNAIAQTLKRLSLAKDARVLIKPNLNSDMVALSGNTTDLRVIISVIESLKSWGFSNIVVGDGTSSGFINSGIDVPARLGIKRLCRLLGVGYADFNSGGYRETGFLNTSIRLARECFEADLFINLPKLKTHAEAMMSACLKNMVGCAVARDKQKVHIDLAAGIVELNKILKPHLHIVDALVSMEDTGPSRGKPKLTGYLIAGDDAFAVDYFLAELCGIGHKRVPCLRSAEAQGLLNGRPSISVPAFKFLEPRPGRLFRIINSPSLRWFFAFIRYLPFFNKILSSSMLSGPLYALGIRQDFFNKTDESVTRIYVDEALCNRCGICVKYCPQGINIPEVKQPFPGCLKCFYCYFICPQEAVKLMGKTGYLDYQISHYKRLIAERLN